ncbi:MAG: hypothetical protein CSA55_05990 [Ilumatobacter coccineus]|uniref:HRDC domain-containing protein n=1 Tax=Ilumatobacter coccineus TaxID=467094 RepID=A0A2G6K6N4_9ACTN|nr:MAG: hypothetical protein CSA55_05990 [Ilumatobacter coccineus]
MTQAGVELLTFHAAKGREWHTVHLIGCETGLVPHRRATTVATKAEEARLLYVAITRATDRLTIHWSRRRANYQRRCTPFLEGLTIERQPAVPRPDSLVWPSRSERSVILDRLRAWRSTTAQVSGILPEAVCSDQALARIADAQPSSATELSTVTGIGPITANRWFEGIAAALDS